MNRNSEQLLAAIQELREHAKRFPQACAPFESIRRYWVPGQLFPPDETVLRQAVNVMVNAGELEMVKNPQKIMFRVTSPSSVINKVIKVS